LSRIGRLPIDLPAGVQVSIDGQRVKVVGPKGELRREFDRQVTVQLQEGRLTVARSSDFRTVRALHGLTRALLANMVTGVTSGFRKTLEIVGVGFRGEIQGNDLVLQVGYSHPVRYTPAEGVRLSVEQGNRIIQIDGIDKETVGETAAKIRAIRRPEPYKGTGIRYAGETVRRKAGKAGKVASA